MLRPGAHDLRLCPQPLKAYAADPKKDLNRLNDYATRMRVASVLRRYLEVLL